MYGNGMQQRRPKRQRKLTIICRPSDIEQHSGGVNSVVLDADGRHLFTAGRDFTVKRWGLADAQPLVEASFEGHTDWVNDVALVDDKVLATCSNDATVRLWRAGSAGQCTFNLLQHTDCVMALAAAPQRGLLASAGLSSEVFVWDLPTGTQLSTVGETFEPVKAKGQKHSVYAVALDDAGALLATGSPAAMVRINDTRSGDKVMKLRGHTDNVRALVFNRQGTMCLSGSSDHTIRLWDLGQQRCVQTFAVHTDSVWCLHADDAFTTVISGGRDRNIYRTQMSTRVSELVACEEAAVTKLAVGEAGGTVWAATAGPNVNQWRMRAELPAPPAAVTSPRGTPASAKVSAALRRSSLASPVAADGSVFVAAASPVVRMRQMQESDAPARPQQEQPAAQLPGRARLVQAAVLPNRRHVLTQDAADQVHLWDVTTASVVAAFGAVDFTAKQRDLFRPVSVPSWFTCDISSGFLAVTLDPQSEQPCFSAEVYAHEMGLTNELDDTKLTYALEMVRGLFSAWGAARGAPPYELPAPATPHARFPGHVRSPFSFTAGPLPPVVACTSSDGKPWRALPSHMDTRTPPDDQVPAWIADAALRQHHVVSKDSKCAFNLLAEREAGLPALRQSRLNAPRILLIHKVVNYVLSKLEDDGIMLQSWPVYVSPEQAQLEPAPDSAAGPALELVCNGMVVPYDLSLATVNDFIWRRKEQPQDGELCILYRIRDPANPAPMPTLEPQL